MAWKRISTLARTQLLPDILKDVMQLAAAELHSTEFRPHISRVTIDSRQYQDLHLGRELGSLIIILHGNPILRNPSGDQPPLSLHTGDIALISGSRVVLPSSEYIRLSNISGSPTIILVGRTLAQTSPAKRCRTAYCTRAACGFSHEQKGGGGGPKPLRL